MEGLPDGSPFFLLSSFFFFLSSFSSLLVFFLLFFLSLSSFLSFFFCFYSFFSLFFLFFLFILFFLLYSLFSSFSLHSFFFSFSSSISLHSFSFVRKRTKQEKARRRRKMAKIWAGTAKATKLAGLSLLFYFGRESGLCSFSISLGRCPAQTKLLLYAVPTQISLRHFPKPVRVRGKVWVWE